MDGARGLSPDGRHQEPERPSPMPQLKEARLGRKKGIVHLLLRWGERNGLGLRLADRECADIPATCSIDQEREAMQASARGASTRTRASSSAA